MGKHPSVKTKSIRKMGQGTGVNYKPYITTSEFNSQGTTSVIKDWKTGRGVHCLSQGEMYWYYILRWDDTNVDIREQYPLEYDQTITIANEMGYPAPLTIMTTDMLVTKSDNTFIAYSIKADKELSERQLQLLCIEKQYWLNKGCQYKLVFKTDINTTLASNIRIVTEFYDATRVFDQLSAIKHKIAIKEFVVDMEHTIIDDLVLKKLLKEL